MNGFINHRPEELLDPHQFRVLKFDARKLFTSVVNNMLNFGESYTRKHTEKLRKRLKLTPAGLLRAEAQLVALGLLHVDVDGEYREYTKA